MKNIYQRLLLSFSIIVFASNYSHAQLQLEEVIVTAQKRTESLMDVPISVSAVSGDKMLEAGITNLQSLTAYVPNFSMNQTGLVSNITVRGISSGVNQGFEQSVGMYNDGIYYGRSQFARAPLLDLERIEVVRGPQPILFGKNSIAGAVSMITGKPTDEFEGTATALYEPDHGEQDYRLVVSGPFSDNLRGRLALLYRDFDGYMKNRFLDRDEKQEEELVVRAALSWDVNESLTANLKLERTEFDTVGRNIEMINSVALPTGGIDYISALSDGVATYNNVLIPAGLRPTPEIPYLESDGILDHTNSAGTDTSNTETDNFTLNIDYQWGDHTLTLVTGYLEYETFQLCECDFTSSPIIDGTTLDEKFDQFSQEIRLTSPGGETIDYIVGLFYQTSTLEFDDKINVPTDGVLRLLSPSFSGISTRRFFDQDTDTIAVFGQATWNVSDAFRLTVGGRLTKEDKDASRRQAHFAGETDFGESNLGLNTLFTAFAIEPYETISDDFSKSAFTPLVTAQYDFNDDIMLYATYTTGFKSGGFDVRSNGHPDPAKTTTILIDTDGDGAPDTPFEHTGVVGVFEFDEEEAKAIEIGAKMGLGDGRGELNIALYRTDYTDLQTSVFDGTLGFNVANAGEAEIWGVELDGRWLVSEGFTLSASLGYLDFEFTKFPVAPCYFGQAQESPELVTGPGTCDAKGERKEYTPELTAALIGDYVTSITDALEFRVSVDVGYTDDYLWAPNLDPRAKQDSFTKVNGRVAVGAADGAWEISLVGKNLTDEDVINFGGNATLAGALTGGTGNAYYAFVDRPRSIALQGIYRF